MVHKRGAGSAEAAVAEMEDFVAQKEMGGRQPRGMAGVILFVLCLLWPLFQLYVTSPIPFLIGGAFVLDYTQTRVVYYAFAIFLAFCAYPISGSAPRDRIPIYDWILAIVGASTALYIFVFYEELAPRAGAPLPQDIVVAVVGLLVLFEATRRAVGIPLTVVVISFMVYVFLGQYMPEAIAHRSASIGRVADHMWLSTQGVFGLPLGVATDFVFLFVLFGALLDKAGAGLWFMQTSFALLGHLQGGPAKASVVSSAMFGMISGSALANVVTTGNFTIPLMKRSGFPAEKAAAVESSSSINGQIMPPVMGAVAFLIVEFVGVSYVEVVKHAVIPATISYIGLYYIVHLESIKLGLRPLPRLVERARSQRALRSLLGFACTFTAMAAIYYGLNFIKATFPDQTMPVIMSLAVLTYIGLRWVASRVPDLTLEDLSKPAIKLPDTVPTLLAGLHYLLPVVVLIWCLIIERLSPSLAIYWSILTILVIQLTQRPILNLMRGRPVTTRTLRRGVDDLLSGMATGSRNMVGISVTMAAAGIIVGGVSLTGIGLLLVTLISTLSGGYLLPMLIITAVITIILGMGLSSTANYLVVAVLVAPVVTTLAAQSGLVIPLVAVHFFVFYCALVSGNTPPVALDAYVAAGIAQANPWATCLQAFYYTMRTMILPFIFVFNTELLLIGVDSWWHGVMVAFVALVAMLAFVAACQGRMLTRSRRYESALLLIVAFTLARPGFWLDQIYPPFAKVDPVQIESFAEQQPAGALIRLWVKGQSFSGRPVEKVVVLPLGPKAPGAERLEKGAGLSLRVENGAVLVDNVRMSGPAAREGIDLDWAIETVEVPTPRPDKAWFYIPAFLLLFLVMGRQMTRRRERPEAYLREAAQRRPSGETGPAPTGA